jgi:hypothetical protein
MGLGDREEREDDWQLSDTEFALLDVNKTLLEIIISAGIVKPDTVDQMLIDLKSKYEKRKMTNAHVVIDLLRAFLSDPRRAELRERLRSILLG